MRVFLVACGCLVLGLAVPELAPGVWPPNVFSIPFALILLGACVVGVPMILMGLVGQALDWTVGPGRIVIEMTNPFSKRTRSFVPDDVTGFSVHEFEGEGGSSDWYVAMTARDGRTYASRHYRSREDAERLLRAIELTFRA